MGQQTTNRLTSREPARQNGLVPAGQSELDVGSEGHFSPLGLCGQLLRDSCGLAQQPGGWDRWAGTAGARRRPPTAPVLLVGEA